jgi:hypothetical protein
MVPNDPPAARASETGNFWLRHQIRQHPAQDQARRPARVQDVQVMRLLLGIERGRERIDDGLARSVGQGKERHPSVKRPVGGLLPKFGEHQPRPQSQDAGEQVQHKRHSHERTVAHAIGEQAEEHNRQPEAPQAAAGDVAELRLGEPELPSPIIEDATADGESDSGGDERDETGQEQPTLACRH